MPYVYSNVKLPDTYILDSDVGWNAGAISIGLIDQGETYRFSVAGTPAGIVTGISAPEANTGYGYVEIQYAFYIANNLYRVMENGVAKTAATPQTSGMLFSIIRIGSLIRYAVNGVVIYESTVPAIAETMIVDASIYAGGDAIINAELTDVYIGTVDFDSSSELNVDFTKTYSLSAQFSGSSELDAGVRLGNSIFMGVNIPTNSVLDAKLLSSRMISVGAFYGSSALNTNMRVHNNRSEASFEPLISLSADSAYATSTTSFEPITTDSAAGFLMPNTASSNAIFLDLMVNSTGLTGEIASSATEFEILDTLSADHAYGESSASFYGLLSAGGVYLPFDAIGFLYAPVIQMYAVGTQGLPAGFDGFIPEIALTANSGGVAKITTPALTISASGTNYQVLRLDAEVPKITLEASSLNGVSALAHATWYYELSLEAYSGGVASLEVPKFSISGDSLSGITGTAVLIAPIVVSNGSVSFGNYGVAELEVPIVTSLYGVAYLETPIFTITASIFNTPVGYTAYSMNVATNAVSVYTDYHFDHIFRFNGVYYGILDSVMYSLDGNSDNGLDIDSAMELAPNDMGTSKLKRIPTTYIGGRADKTIIVSPMVDETKVGDYTAVALDRTGTHTRRVDLPRGAKGRYWGVKISNVAGDALDIDHVEYRLEVLKRKV